MLCLQVDEILKSPFMNVENLQRQPRFLRRQKGPPVVSEDGIAAIAEDTGGDEQVAADADGDEEDELSEGELDVDATGDRDNF